MHLVNTKDLIDQCKSGDRKAQQQLFNQLSSPMMGVCIRYLKNTEDAEEVLLDGFYKMFRHLNRMTYQGEKSFFGWVKKIMINEALMRLRKNKEIRSVAINEEIDENLDVSPIKQLEVEDLLKIIQMIPIGYRTVFNLHEIEGYSHKEIGEALKISVGTSKSQLFKAKKLLQVYLKSENNEYRTKYFI